MVKTGSRWYIIMPPVYSIYGNLQDLNLPDVSGRNNSNATLRNSANELCINPPFELRQTELAPILVRLEGMPV